MKKIAFVAVMALCSVVVPPQCKSEEQGGGAALREGRWLGRTAQDKEISFVVKDGAVSEVSLGWLGGSCWSYSGSGGAQSSEGGPSRISLKSPVPIVGDAFTVKWSEPAVELTLSASFSKAAKVTGQVDILGKGSCHGPGQIRWVAARMDPKDLSK